jgi:hypothetical protein
MSDMDIISLCEKLKPEDWDKPATSKWRVKDVISHLAGWEREVAMEFKRTWPIKAEPWFMRTDFYDDFNAKICEEFRDYSPAELMGELKKWQSVVEKEIKEVGEDVIRRRPNMSWLFDEGDEPHFAHHIRQIEEALKI